MSPKKVGKCLVHFEHVFGADLGHFATFIFILQCSMPLGRFLVFGADLGHFATVIFISQCSMLLGRFQYLFIGTIQYHFYLVSFSFTTLQYHLSTLSYVCYSLPQNLNAIEILLFPFSLFLGVMRQKILLPNKRNSLYKIRLYTTV